MDRVQDNAPILQAAIPEDQRAAAARPLPGMAPVSGDWWRRDAACAAQLAEKARLLAERPDDVLAVLPGAEAACAELYAMVAEGPVPAAPLRALAGVLQEDLCILQKQGEAHVLTAALLCFPAGWTLAEKIGRPLGAIHGPVRSYDAGIAARVQRLFDGVQAGRPMWRANLLRYDSPALYQPHSEAHPRPVGGPDSAYERSERQTVLRLPRTGAVVFAIHTTMTRRQM